MEDNNKIIEKVIKTFEINKEELEKLINRMEKEMINGLEGKESTLKMLPTYAPYPTGKETGIYMGIDIGGTNLRVITLEIPKAGIRGKTNQKEWVLPKTAKVAHEFFGFVANSIKEFLIEYKLIKEEIKAGLTFSFPVEQIAINKGISIMWSKGWNVEGVKGKEIVEIINKELKNNNINNVNIIALVNDTVGTLANKAYDDNSIYIGMIIGTGTNGCYVENNKAFNKNKLKSKVKEEGKMIVNIEWGGMNIEELKYTKYDKYIDEISVNKGYQRFEKMISGIYMGWLARLVIRDLIKNKIILKDYLYHKAFEDTPDDIDIEQTKKFTSRNTYIIDDNTENLDIVNKELISLGINNSNLYDRQIIRKVCEVVVKRSAYLATAAMICVSRHIRKYENNKNSVAIDGSVYEKSKPFKRFMDEAIKLLSDIPINCQLSKDGSGLGAIIVAASVAFQ